MSTQAQIQLATESRENAHALEIESSKRITSQLSKKLDNAREILLKTAETLTACNDAIIAELNNDLEIHDDDDPADITRDETAYIEGLAGDTVVQTGKPEPQNAPEPAPALPIPRIDSSRCLSCGACIGINDKIFAFNENDQAIITDPNATIEDVREAAETCPANCIIIE
jgi:ferredoxin